MPKPTNSHLKKKKKKTKSRTPEGGDKKLSETKKPTKE